MMPRTLSICYVRKYLGLLSPIWGNPSKWVPNNERYDFWKDEVKAHLAAPDSKAALEDFPGEYCYFASEWKSYDGDTIILLSKAH